MKKMFSLIFIVASAFLSTEVIAQQLTPPQQTTVNKLFKSNDLAYFKFKVHSMSEIAQFAKTLSIDKQEGALLYVHATKAQFSQFIRINYAYTVIPHTAAKKKTTKAAPAKKVIKKK